jgi:vitamin B12 transporter
MISIVSVPRAPVAACSLGLALFAAFSADVSAQATLPPVVVTGSREPTPLSGVTGDLVVIDADRIRESTADSVEDLLRREAGLQVSRTGGPGQGAGVFIRGASASSTVVLIDGVRIGSATLGQAGLEGLAVSQIERIEVLRGPGSSLYGADAVGGVVQIFTRRGTGGLRLTAKAAVGSYGSRQSDVAASGSVANIDYAASVSHDKSDGVSAIRPGDLSGLYNPDHDGYVRNSAQLSVGVTPVVGHRIGLVAMRSRTRSQYDGSEYLAPNFAQDATPDFRSRLVSAVTAFDYRGQIDPVWTTSVQAAHNEDDSQSGGTVQSRYLTLRDQLTWQNAVKLGTDQQIVIAYEGLREKARADSYLAPVQRTNNALLIGHSGSFGVHAVQVDLRHDANSVYGANTTGRLGWNVEVAPGMRARALVGTTFRAPSFNDLYYPDYGVATIRPERGRSAEVGLAWQADGSAASVSVYRNQVHDLIGYQADRSFCPPDPGYNFGCAGNTSRARLQGATLTGSQRWAALSLRGSIDFLDAKDADTGQRLRRRAAHQESVSADYDLDAWTLGASVLRIGARPDAGVQLAGYATLDLRARWRFASQWQLEAQLLNATDRAVEPARDYQGLGRQAWLGVRFDGKGL